MNFEDPTYLEAVYAALFNRLKTAAFAGGQAFAWSTRAFEPPDDVPPASQPALVLVQGPLHAEQREVFGPTKWTFTALAMVYVRAESTAPEPDPLPATVANYFVWGLQNALAGATPPVYDRQTFDGLVYHCWIEGAVSVAAQREQIVITIPIYILVGPSG